MTGRRITQAAACWSIRFALRRAGQELLDQSTQCICSPPIPCAEIDWAVRPGILRVFGSGNPSSSANTHRFREVHMGHKWGANINAQSLVLGVLIGAGGLALLGASENGPSSLPSKRFLVLESTPKGEPGNGRQTFLLKVCPHYGKISAEGLKFSLKNETQELTFLISTEQGHDIRRGDILAFESLKQIQLSPGSRVIRHLPSGGQELVP
jgi:hypothetical protein